MKLQQEIGALCSEVWSHLNQRLLNPLNEWEQSQPFPTLAEALAWFQQSASTQFLNIAEIGTQDTLFLQNLGLSVAFLKQNLAETTGGQHLDPLRFQLEAVRRGNIPARCPFSGVQLTSRQSLLANVNVIFYRFESRQTFYLAVAGIGSGFRKSAFYFPESDLVVTGGDSWGLQPEDLVELKARMVSSASLCYRYLVDPKGKGRRTAVSLGFYHFAHHLWNELSGIHRLERSDLLQTVDKFLVLREPMGPLEQIFPEIKDSQIERIESTHELFRVILEQDYFAVRVGDNYIPQDLAARVARVSSAQCSAGTLASVRAARERYSPLVWVGIRVGNRSWTDQAEGLTEVIAALQQNFPEVGIVFDGFSVPADKEVDRSEQQGYSGILAQENEIVDTILHNLTQRGVSVGIINIIGQSILDANVWARAIDVYLSPHGSLQHKVGWLANKHGIVHTNLTLLGNPPKYVWEAVEGAIPPRYVSASAVTDLHLDEDEQLFYNEISDASETGAGVRAANKRARKQSEFSNYAVDWKALHAELSEMIRSPRTKPGLAAVVMAHRARRRFRNMLRRLVSAFR